MKQIAIPFLSLLLFASLGSAGCDGGQTDIRQAEDCINEGNLERHVLTLASNEYQGRKPFTAGETKTINYIKNEFEKLGLEGGNEGSYFQNVPLVEITGEPSPFMTVSTNSGPLRLAYLDEFIAATSQIAENIVIENSELVFAGYGIVAPEYDWNDYEGLDARGKTVLVLVNDPGFATQEKSLFRGNAMTYYGRWTYKYEEAARQGAEGVIVIHETAPAGYPWLVLRNGAAGADLVLQSDDNNMSRCAMEGWLTLDAAHKLFEKVGEDFDALTEAASRRGFKPLPLQAAISVSIKNDLRFDTSKNVLGLLRGTTRADECIVYTAHWDHLGIGPAVDGDSIYNGAADNALPVACMLETARAFSKLRQRPARSVLFVAVTAEESGLLGSEYYAANPVFPLIKTAANLNYELFVPLGRMKDVTIFGYGQSELDDYVADAAAEQGRYIIEEPFPEKGMYFRTDHFSFAKRGVPSLFVKGWTEHTERGKDWTRERVLDFWANTYHTPHDEYDPQTADLAGIADDAKLFFRIGYRLSNEERFPVWREGSEFKEIREESIAKTK